MDFDNYRNYLKFKVKIPKDQIAYYLGWVTQFFAYCNKNPGQPFDPSEVHAFLGHLENQCESWQVQQAKKAIELYRYVQSTGKRLSTKNPASPPLGAWKKAADNMVKRLRLKGCAYKTEQTYLHWLRDFYRFVDNASPETISDRETRMPGAGIICRRYRTTSR